MNKEQSNIVTPVALSKELGIKPQLVFSWVRSEKIPHESCVCGHTYLLRDQIADFLTARDEKQAAKEAKVEAELAEKSA